MFLLVVICILSLASVSLAERPSTCPGGYTKLDSYCFLLLQEPSTFVEAATLCDIVDGKVVQITSKEEQERVNRFLKGKNANYLWMGATKFRGDWMMLSSNFEMAMKNFDHWAANYPKDCATSNCIVMNQAKGWQWENTPCHQRHKVLCEERLRD